MEKMTYHIPGINCGHCVHTIKTELSELKGVVSVEGDIAAKQITVSYEPPATLDGIESLLREINYAPAQA